jgi:hypothetical protein
VAGCRHPSAVAQKHRVIGAFDHLLPVDHIVRRGDFEG